MTFLMHSCLSLNFFLSFFFFLVFFNSVLALQSGSCWLQQEAVANECTYFFFTKL